MTSFSPDSGTHSPAPHETTVLDTPPRSVQDRLSSTVHRETVDGRCVYVKRYKVEEPNRPIEVVQARTQREAEVLERLAAESEISGRLGVVRLARVDAERGEIVTFAAPGRAVQNLLFTDFRRCNFNTLRALFLAGRWLQVFQRMPVSEGSGERLSNDPENLVEYCALRIRRIRESGYGWPGLREADHLLSVIEALVRAAPPEDRDGVWTHADYAPVNLLWDRKRLTVIDFPMSRIDLPLLDVSYFVHRLELLAWQFPWRRWPLAEWRKAFLRGYGRPQVMTAPMYRALAIRHLLCRLASLASRPGARARQRLHNRWLRACVRRRLLAQADA